MNTKVSDKILDIANEDLGIVATTDSRFVSDMDCDELDLVELAMGVEDGLGVDISDRTAEHWYSDDATMGEISRNIEDLVGGV